MDIDPSEKANVSLEEVLISPGPKFSFMQSLSKLNRSDSRSRKTRLIVVGITLFIIALAVIYYSNSTRDNSISIDESDYVKLFLNRGQEFIPWQKGQPVKAGDRLAVRILTDMPAVAWMDVYNKTAKAVDHAEPSAITMMRVKAVTAQYFPKTLALTDPKADLVLVVLICARKSLEGMQPSSGELADWMDGIYNHDQEFMNGCSGTRIPLGQ